MLIEYLTAVGLIFVAEMGDKTQILAMTFATKYKVKLVLLGIFIGSFLNHGLAVLLGSALSTIIPIDLLQVIAGISFIGFALWTLKLDEDDSGEVKQSYGPIITVSLAFFIGELGDKTQLTAIVLSTDANYPFLILLGTVTGMVITGGLGILVGAKIGSKIPEFTIKMFSATVFMLFGIIKLAQYLPTAYTTPLLITIYVLVIGTATILLLRPTLAARKLGTSAYQLSAQKLYNFYNKLSLQIDDICLGEEVCGGCSKSSCIVGATKHLLKNNDEDISIDLVTLGKDFDRNKIAMSLEEILGYLKDNPSTDTIISTKNNLEMILFGKSIQYNNRKDYLSQIEELDIEIFKYLS